MLKNEYRDIDVIITPEELEELLKRFTVKPVETYKRVKDF